MQNQPLRALLPPLAEASCQAPCLRTSSGVVKPSAQTPAVDQKHCTQCRQDLIVTDPLPGKAKPKQCSSGSRTCWWRKVQAILHKYKVQQQTCLWVVVSEAGDAVQEASAGCGAAQTCMQPPPADASGTTWGRQLGGCTSNWTDCAAADRPSSRGLAWQPDTATQ